MSFGFIKKPKVFLPVFGLILVVLVIVAVIRNMNQPAVGSINQTPQTEAIKADPFAQPGNYQGKYISFTFPAHYKRVPSAVNGNSLEVDEYHATDSSGKLINIAVYPGSVSSDSGVAYRRQHKELYTESDSQKWTEFARRDGTEDTFYIEHNGRTASVSCTAPYNNQAGDALFVASGLKWR